MSARSTAAVDSRSSQSAIGSSVSLREIAGEGAGRLRARTFGAVHVDGQSEHETDGAPLGGERQQPLGIGIETLAAMV